RTTIKADPVRAREMFAYAASYFGDPDAQYYLARIYLDGDGCPKDPRQAARGLMWLTLAKDGATPDQAWIGKLYDSAFRQATEDERALALVYLERWLKTRRE